MADVRPLKALHYNPSAITALDDVVAPPYDVIDAARRAELLRRSPFNVVELDLPEAADGADPYEHAAATLEEWTLQGILAADRDPALWALTQDYTGPDGTRRTRRGLLCRVRVTDYGPGLVRPHERTQPGPKEDRLRLTEATRHNLSPIFSLHAGDAWRHVEGYTRSDPWAEITDDEGTVHRVWRIADEDTHRAVAAELAESELLIADGHHRYETARTYADAVGGDGAHRYTLMALVSLDDPGLTVFGYHRLLSNLGEPAAQEALADAIRAHFELEEVPLDRLDPAGEEGIGVFGYVDAHFRKGYRLRLKDSAVLERAIPGVSGDYRRLDAAILETLILREGLGMSAEDVEAKRGISYTASAERALASLDEGIHAAFLMRPTPVEQVRAVAAAGETMPPKSTYFYPKLLTGLVFNPLS
ncbi:MAG TPA: DUF1015 domain-containing protein [Solirubrobacterales bacterium]|nr:DUF1015 domain-containing protein [Solirubrobacterales bacterium]